MKSYLLLILFLVSIDCFSSSRISVKKEFENVVLFYDGSVNNEQYTKLEFIAKRVLLLSKQHNYSEKIILNYLFLDDGSKNKDYFIAYSKPTYYYDSEEKEPVNLFDENKKFIMLTAYDEIRNQIEALKLIDFALSDLENFKQLKVEKIEYQRFENELNYVYSVSPKAIRQILNNKLNSERIVNALGTEIYRDTEDNNTFFISYFTKNDKYFPYLRERNKITVLDTLSLIKYYSNEYNDMFIFKDNFEFNFYSFDDFGENLIIKRNVIYNEEEDFICSYVSVDKILSGVFLIKYSINILGTLESSLYTIEKGFIEKKLSKYEYHPEIKW